MAAGLFNRGFSLLRRTFHPDHGAEFACLTYSGQRRRNRDHGRGGLLFIMVQTAGLQARAQRTALTTGAGPDRHCVAGSISRAKIPAERSTSCWVRLPNENWLMK